MCVIVYWCWGTSVYGGGLYIKGGNLARYKDDSGIDWRNEFGPLEWGYTLVSDQLKCRAVFKLCAPLSVVVYNSQVTELNSTDALDHITEHLSVWRDADKLFVPHECFSVFYVSVIDCACLCFKCWLVCAITCSVLYGAK